MPFAVGIGDVIALGKLIKDITDCLQSVGGAKSEYQELIREFDALDSVLRHLDTLHVNTGSTTHIESIKCAALGCRVPLEEFLTKARRYEKTLGIWKQSKAVKRTTDKLRWTFGLKDDVKRLQTYLNVHIGMINMLLTEHGFERMDINSKRAEENSAEIRKQIDDTHTTLDEINKILPSQALLLRNMHSMVTGLYQLVRSEMRTSLEHFTQVISKVYVSTQRMDTVVHDIRDSMITPDTRWAFFQAPYVVEDARGHKFPVPSEFDYDMLDNIVRHRFKEGAGSQDVVLGNYEFCKTNVRSATITATSKLAPGTALTMAVILSSKEVSTTSCPMPTCNSLQAEHCPGGGFICSVCNVWFDKATKGRKDVDLSLTHVEAFEGYVTIDTPVHAEEASSARKRKRDEYEQEEQLLRNVKIAYNAISCSKCDRVFSGRYHINSLRTHKLAKHSPEVLAVKHTCRECPQTFRRGDARRKHEWKKHRILDAKPKKRTKVWMNTDAMPGIPNISSKSNSSLGVPAMPGNPYISSKSNSSLDFYDEDKLAKLEKLILAQRDEQVQMHRGSYILSNAMYQERWIAF